MVATADDKDAARETAGAVLDRLLDRPRGDRTRRPSIAPDL